VGRPLLAEECRQLIRQMAEENPTWGYFRIRGELIKLGYMVSATAIRSVVRGQKSIRIRATRLK
jgi:putative transposase